MFEINCLDIYGNTITRLTQWDINQKIVIKNYSLSNAPYFHFCNKKSKEAIVVLSALANNEITVEIPNSLLQEPYPIIAYMYYFEDNSAKTIYTIKIPVVPRVKPSGYTDDTGGNNTNNNEQYVTINYISAISSTILELQEKEFQEAEA